MTSTIVSTLSSSIGFIQLKLTDYDQKEFAFDNIINQRFKTVETPLNIHQKLELPEDNHIDYINPICPHCQAKKVNKQEYRERNLIIENQEPIKVYLRRYLCKFCNKKFITSLKSIIKPGYKYSSIFTEKFIELFKTGYRSLRNASDDLSNFFGVKISHQTIHNWMQTTTENHISNIETNYSGYYCYDEQYVIIKGIWMYRLILFDQILNIPVYEKISPDKKYTTIIQFIYPGY